MFYSLNFNFSAWDYTNPLQYKSMAQTYALSPSHKCPCLSPLAQGFPEYPLPKGIQ